MSVSLSDTDSRTLILYGTDACHLCELALAIVLAEPLLRGWALDYIDVAFDEQLLATFGAQIPVLSWPARGQLLFWPFDAAAVHALIAGHALD